jgi:hypothetical protein
MNLAAGLSLLPGISILAIGIVSYRTLFSLDHSTLRDSTDGKRGTRWYFVVTCGSCFVSHSVYWE